MTRRRTLALVALLLIGAYEAGHGWLECMVALGSIGGIYGCSVVLFDIHHFDALLLLSGAGWTLWSGFKRGG